jgi:hypothetical protein
MPEFVQPVLVPEPLSVSTACAVSSAFAPAGFVWKPLQVATGVCVAFVCCVLHAGLPTYRLITPEVCAPPSSVGAGGIEPPTSRL